MFGYCESLTSLKFNKYSMQCVGQDKKVRCVVIENDKHRKVYEIHEKARIDWGKNL